MNTTEEIAMRWAVAAKVWEQIKGWSCVETAQVVKENECNSRFLWEMYPGAKLECKGGTQTFKFKVNACSFAHATVKPVIDSFLATDEAVKKGCEKLGKMVDELKEIFTKEYLEGAEKAIDAVMYDDKRTVYPILNDQGVCIVAHHLLSWEPYRKWLGDLNYWASMAVHYLKVRKYQLYVGAGVGGLILLLFLLGGSGGGGGSTSSATVIIRKE